MAEERIIDAVKRIDEEKSSVREILPGLKYELPPSQEKSNIFLCRYWYAYPVSKIAKQFGLTENNVSVTLNRTRKKLKEYLTERGYEL